MDGRRGEGLEPYRDFLGRDMAAVKADLETLLEMLGKWQSVQNLVSRETGEFWDRHVLDSLQLLPLMAGEFAHMRDQSAAAWTAGRLENGAARTLREPVRIVDIGSGGGFPALPLAIALKESGAGFDLVEANGRKCAFLRAVTRTLDLPVTVHNGRIEAMDAETLGPAAILTVRALAPLPRLFAYLHRFWGPQTRALLHKGREYGEELQQADSAWAYDVVKHGSRTDPEGVILVVEKLRHRES